MSPAEQATLFDLAVVERTARVVAESEGADFTPEQAQAVDRREGSVLLSAGAGSGKTSVLVERFVRAVLDDGVDPARVLAITFTDKAAGELRERLRDRFVELGEREQARATEAAFVSTIHGFCARLLRAHALTAGLDPRFTVLSEVDAARMRERSFEVALGAFLADRGPAGVDLVAAYGAARLATTIESVHERLRSAGQTAPTLPPPTPRHELPAVRRELAGASEAAVAELAEAAPSAQVESALAALARCADLLSRTAPDGQVPTPADVTAAGFTQGAGSALKGPACTAYVAACKRYEEACADHHAAPAVVLLDALLRHYGIAYADAKRARAAVDFDDLELMARDVLRSAPPVRESWATRFELVMVDEFQDTNPRQLAILEMLERDNLFTVGDAFQSIYGFRHADVELFRARDAALGARGAKLSLTVNFRGRAPLLGAVNAVFGATFGPAYAPLRPGREHPGEEPLGEPLVELLVTHTKGWDAEGVDLGQSLPAAPPWRQAEARLLAQRVGELIDAGSARAGEIAVLLRASSDIEVYERALQDRGIATLAVEGRGYWSRIQVADLRAYLTALANPLDERALLALLASPLVGASPDALAVVVTVAREAGRGVWHLLEQAFVTSPSDELEGGGLAARLPDADRERLAAFAPRLAGERRQIGRLPLDLLLERAIAATAYDLHVLRLPGGEARLANVYKLLRLARDYEVAHGGDLRGFLDFAQARESHAREPDAPIHDVDRDAVRLMTIHAAKGLEFDVVCLADLGRAPRGETPEVLTDGGRVGIRLAALGSPDKVSAFDYDALREESLAAEAQEEERIFYVAMTRARERLVLSGAADCERWPRSTRGGPPLAWIAPALVPNFGERVAQPPPVWDLDAEVEGHRVGVRCAVSMPSSLGEVLRDAAPDTRGSTAATPASAPTPAPHSSWPGTRPAIRRAPDAISYSSLAAYARCGYRYYAERELGLPEEAPPGAPVAGRSELDARLRGTLVHTLLERFEFTAPAAPTREDLATLAQALGARLTEDDARQVTAMVEDFGRSPVCARLARAGEVHREHEFAFVLGGEGTPLVTGVMDVLAESDGEALVVDYKSDRVAASDLEALVERDYATQREIYALAALRAGAATAEVVHVFLERPDEPVTARYERSDATRLADSLRGVAEGLLAGTFEVTPEPHRDLCATCPARRGLCSWNSTMTLRPAPPVRGAGLASLPARD